jgi:TRAP-type transport system small permease protein
MSDDAHVPAPAPVAPAIRVARVAADWARTVLGLLLIGMVLVNVVNAMFRYLFSLVMIGADEILVYAMVWLVMIGMILVTVDQRHIALDFLVNRLGPRSRIALAMFHNLIIAVAGAYTAVECLEFTRRVAEIGQTSMALGLPMVFAHSALVVGFTGTALAAALLAISGAAELMSTPSRAETRQP